LKEKSSVRIKKGWEDNTTLVTLCQRT